MRVTRRFLNPVINDRRRRPAAMLEAGARRDGYGDLTFYRKPRLPLCWTTRGAISLRRIIRRRYCHARTPYRNRLNGDVLFYTYVSSGWGGGEGGLKIRTNENGRNRTLYSRHADVCAFVNVCGECGTKTKVLSGDFPALEVAGAIRFRCRISNTISDSQTYAVAKP